MKIKILGTGCPKCKKLEENAREALNNAGKKAEIIKITDINKIVDYEVMSMPAILVDDKLKCSGRIPDIEEIEEWLK